MKPKRNNKLVKRNNFFTFIVSTRDFQELESLLLVVSDNLAWGDDSHTFFVHLLDTRLVSSEACATMYNGD
ncbi:hypothetical protein D3C76_1502760 [compost metagenome]